MLCKKRGELGAIKLFGFRAGVEVELAGARRQVFEDAGDGGGADAAGFAQSENAIRETDAARL